MGVVEIFENVEWDRSSFGLVAIRFNWAAGMRGAATEARVRVASRASRQRTK